MTPTLVRLGVALVAAVPLLVLTPATATTAWPTGVVDLPSVRAAGDPAEHGHGQDPAPGDEASPDPAGTDHDDMVGMDHDDMVGMDHGGGQDPAGHDAAPSGAHPTAGASGDRPRALVLGGFVVVNAAVLTAAAVLRRRDRTRPRRRRPHVSPAATTA